jgi:hypothetical protein
MTAPFDLVLSKGADGWAAQVQGRDGTLITRRHCHDGDDAIRAAKSSVLHYMGRLVDGSLPLPPEVEALFSEPRGGR